VLIVRNIGIILKDSTGCQTSNGEYFVLVFFTGYKNNMSQRSLECK